ncbi:MULTISPECIES: ABC transporter permease subunit [Leptolyngbya]|jgi:ribose transport system permease protein|uniref:Inner-membrane translocator n=1 Tax=Leptolyngbya boryana NIES-2135 TaxID=1973484 RepID=A0A1Z4JGC2_LEPBY|nr:MULTISPECIES: ribose ABC transporter permease [Leptolyngbya]BAY55718.1 inner-membrane translocator [Leptolyngbya boryana NIES-2135]MBD2370388.1 ribose ABC transporter permease [Leptolyngbya sp. FACHB-161]MBD2376732.1 ribose ABC transporter permease [Leptolyngbya sp. FACHB-238]MBD2401003.1 ribose ABC transporter permease [Leptolyngbya sp. FACHB-239]MBD2407650.1 ribose ABC transporter permease [Leptolyngbya sp. FACHB-402]
MSQTELRPLKEPSDRPPNRRKSTGNWLQIAGILPILVIICILFSILTPNFPTAGNVVNIFRQASINIVLATGLTFVILTGGIDLSVGSILGVSAVVGVLVSLSAVSWLAIPAALLTGLAIGLINGALIAFLDLPPFIVTLGGLTALRGTAYLVANGTTVLNRNLNFAWVGNSYLGPFPWLVVIALLTVLASWFVLRRTVLGVQIYAVGGNQRAARLTGIKVNRVLLFVYGVSGLLAGLAGIMSSSRLYSATGLLGNGYELDAIAAVILGGTSFTGGIGTIPGTLLGALIIAVLNNGLTLLNMSYFWQLVVKGLVIIVAVVIDRLRRRSTR